jgi:ribosome maturation factor RimP
MMLPVEIEDRRLEIEAQIESLGAQLIEIGFRHTGSRGVLTILVDKPGGIQLEECAEINRVLGDFLDRENLMAGAYNLEVNSPGLDRPLKTQKDFLRTAGEPVKVFYREESGRMMDFVGEVVLAEQEIVEFKNAKTGVLVRLPLESIVKAVRHIGFK